MSNSTSSEAYHSRTNTPLVIGSAMDADILIEHVTIDSKHCSLEKRSDGSFVVRDLGSKNGTFVISLVALKHSK